MIDTQRSAGTTYSTPTDRDIVVTRTFAARRALVFDAWTNPAHLPKWLTGPEGWSMPVCEIDLRPGGAWHYQYSNSRDGGEMDLRGLFREVTPPERIVTTESWGPEWPETVNTVEFSESNGRTTVTMTVTYHSREARDAALESGTKDGMNMSFNRLESFLERARGA